MVFPDLIAAVVLLSLYGIGMVVGYRVGRAEKFNTHLPVPPPLYPSDDEAEDPDAIPWSRH